MIAPQTPTTSQIALIDQFLDTLDFVPTYEALPRLTEELIAAISEEREAAAQRRDAEAHVDHARSRAALSIGGRNAEERKAALALAELEDPSLAETLSDLDYARARYDEAAQAAEGARLRQQACRYRLKAASAVLTALGVSA